MSVKTLLGCVALAILLRGIGWNSIAATDVDLAGVGSFSFVAELNVRRIVALLVSSLTVAVLAQGLVRHGKPRLAPIATLLLALDPLSLHAAHGSLRSNLLELAGAFLVRAAMTSDRSSRGRALAAAIVSLVTSFLTQRGDLAPDPVLAAWAESPLLGFAAAFVHHAGYMLVPLALFAGFRERSLLLAAAAPLVACAGFASPRLADLAGAMPALVTLVASGLDAAAQREREQGSSRLVVPGLLLLILASNAPVLLSDLASGLRYPWAQARAWLANQRDLDPATTRVFALEPEVAQRALGPRFTIERLPVAQQALAAVLDARHDEVRERIVILPVSSGQLQSCSRPELLAQMEARKLADFAATAKRFDLYRLELRVFRFR